MKYFTCHSLSTRHVVLLDDNCDFGKKHNDRVFKMLKEWIDGILTFSIFYKDKEIVKAQAPIEQAFTSLIGDFVNGLELGTAKPFGPIELKIIANNPFFCLNKLPSKNQLTLNLPKRLTLSEANTFHPLYQIKEDDDYYYITIELPGFDLKENNMGMNAKVGYGTKKNHFGYTISGEKIDPYNAKVNKRDFRKFGKWEVHFDIPLLKYSRNDKDISIIDLGNGYIQFKFCRINLKKDQNRQST